MIPVIACLFAAVVLLTVSAYAAGRADGWHTGRNELRREYREEAAQRNLHLNKQIIDHAVKGKA